MADPKEDSGDRNFLGNQLPIRMALVAWLNNFSTIETLLQCMEHRNQQLHLQANPEECVIGVDCQVSSPYLLDTDVGLRDRMLFLLQKSYGCR